MDTARDAGQLTLKYLMSGERPTIPSAEIFEDEVQVEEHHRNWSQLLDSVKSLWIDHEGPLFISCPEVF